MERVLFIPHGSDPNLKIRGFDLARALAERGDCQIYYLEQARNFSAGFWDKLTFLVREATRPITIEAPKKNFSVVRIPYLHLGLSPRTLPLIRALARGQISRLIRQLKPTIVINESYFAIAVPGSPRYRLIYDLVDNHLPGAIDGWFGQIVGNFTMKQLKQADRIWSISHTLVDELNRLGYPNVRYVPNGTALADFGQVGATARTAARQKLGLANEYVIGYIGNHAYWSGIDFVLDLARQSPASWLYLIVGAGTEVEQLDRTQVPTNVRFVGAIPRSQVSDYFLALDVGILPFRKMPLTDGALPIKIIDYGAARKLVVAEPLAELVRLGLPHVIFPKARTVTAWLASLEKARTHDWQTSWQKRIEAYDWHAIAQTITWQ